MHPQRVGSGKRLRTKSTNPFDSSDEESLSGDVFQDCMDTLDDSSLPEGRTALLDFNFRTTQSHEPALQFDVVGRQSDTLFASPLVTALDGMRMDGGQTDTTSSKWRTRTTPSGARKDSKESFESPWSRVLRLASGRIRGTNDYDECDEPEISTIAAEPGSEEQYPATPPVATPKRPLHPKSTVGQKGRIDPLRSSFKTMKARSILEKLDNSDCSTETPWTKMILLEELGTASSWTILIIPYIAFFLCLLLDTHSSLVVTSLGPLDGATTCASSGMSSSNIPLLPAPDAPCSYNVSLEPGKGLLAQGRKSYLFQTYHYGELMSNGTAFASGPISGVSPLSPFLHGDATFSDLLPDTTALVAKGRVLVSAIVLQRSVEAVSGWVPVFIAKPEILSMSCVPSDSKRAVSKASRWDCRSPRIIDVLFPMPGTGVLSLEEIQVNVLFSLYKPPRKPEKAGQNIEVANPSSSFVYSESTGYLDLLSDVDIFHPNDNVASLVWSSSYTIEHESQFYRRVKIGVRLSAMVMTILFTIFWCWSLGMKGFFATGNQPCCCQGLFYCFRSQNKEELPLTGAKRRGSTWWDSPWIVFPERRYLMLLLLALILVQNPLFALAYFRSALYTAKDIHRAADSMVGIGVHLFLLVWLCLLQSLRFHSAEVARRRARYQLQALELRRVANYMAQPDALNYGTEEYVNRYTSDYYQRYGDLDGSGSTGTLHVRLYNDPCGDSWADFLLPKLFLFVVGALSVTIASWCRYPTTSESTAVLSSEELYRYNAAYAGSSISQLFVLVVWALLIFSATIDTGRSLRKEPFLSTRPAQLAFRVLLGITVLGFGALLVPFASDFMGLLAKWTGPPSSQTLHLSTGVGTSSRSSNTLDVLLRLLLRVGEKFPYSGTAASVGPGKLIFATACAFVACFIFLPSRPFMGDKNASDRTADLPGMESVFSPLLRPEILRQRKDKRTVVALARYTKTWRVFPLPIKKLNTASLLSETSFYLDPTSERSIAYFDRYTPVFCLELACWLLEASWQAYYSPTDYSLDDFAPGRMSLDRIGLCLENSFFDEDTDTQAFIASNVSSQVDGEEDSIIVVAFRGTASSKNVQTDLKSRIVPLPEQITGRGDKAVLSVYPDRVDTCDDTGRFWEKQSRDATRVQSYSPNKVSKSEIKIAELAPPPNSSVFSVFSATSRIAKALIRATPMARQTLPCVHAGFLEAYMNIRKQVLEAVLKVLQRQVSNAVIRTRLSEAVGDGNAPLVLPKIYVCGHSLGGSLGQILALDIASNCEVIIETQPMPETASAEELFHLPFSSSDGTLTAASGTGSGRTRTRFFSFDDADGIAQPKRRTLALQPPIAVYTYGQTRVGNKAFARVYKQRVPHTFRVANERDAFTTLPTPLLCGGRYKHAGLEVVLDEGCTGNTLVGPNVVETLFRFSRMRTSVSAHSMERYRDCLASALRPDELEEYYRGHGTLATREKRDAQGASSETTDVAEEELPSWLTQVRRSAT